MVTEKKLKDLQNTLCQDMDQANEKDIVWIMKWHNIKKKSSLFDLSEKRLIKIISDLRGLMVGRHIRENR